MSGLVFRIKADGFDGIVRRFDQLEERIPRAIAMGLNDGGAKVATQVKRALWKQTGAKNYRSITSRVRTSSGFAEGDRITATEGSRAALGASMTYQIVGTGHGMPIKEFPVSIKRGRGGGVDAKPWGVDHLFKRSFSIDGSVDGARARTTSKRFPLRTLYGPAIPKEMVKGSVPTVFYLSSVAFVPPAILRQLARVL